jgi:hypothetical protein
MSMCAAGNRLWRVVSWHGTASTVQHQCHHVWCVCACTAFVTVLGPHICRAHPFRTST